MKKNDILKASLTAGFALLCIAGPALAGGGFKASGNNRNETVSSLKPATETGSGSDSAGDILLYSPSGVQAGYFSTFTNANGSTEVDVVAAPDTDYDGVLGLYSSANNPQTYLILSSAGIAELGPITFGTGLSGAGALTWTSGPKTYIIDFAAFSAGVNDTSAQTMTGVLMGDTCSVSSATDLSASIGQLSARPTSADHIIIVASGVSTISTANPASDTFTVRCNR